jgi:hypothetical protein
MSIARVGPPPRRREAEKGKEKELKDENMLVPRKLKINCIWPVLPMAL